MTNLLEQTRQMLSRETATHQAIADGAGVGYHWLVKFSQGRIPDPRISRIQKLHDFLSARQTSNGSED
jgi:hypothetical protein